MEEISGAGVNSGSSACHVTERNMCLHSVHNGEVNLGTLQCSCIS